MLRGLDTLAEGPLAPRADKNDPARERVLAALLKNDPDHVSQLYGFAVQLWAEIADQAFSDNTRNSRLDKTLDEISQICHWVNHQGLANPISPGHQWHDKALIVFGQVNICMGRLKEAEEALLIVASMDPKGENWAAGMETLIRATTALEKFDEAERLTHVLLTHYPQNQYALDILEAIEIDRFNEANSQSVTSTRDFDSVNSTNVAEYSQKLAAELQTSIAALMSGSLPMEEKMSQIQALQTTFEADMKALMAKLSNG